MLRRAIGLFQYRPIGGVADSHRAFTTGSERNAGRQSHLGLEQQPLAEIERVGSAADLGEEIESAVGLRHGNARHLRERGQAKVAILLKPYEHFGEHFSPHRSAVSPARA